MEEDTPVPVEVDIPIVPEPAPAPKKVRKPKPKPTKAVLGDTTEVVVEKEAVIFYGAGRYRVHGHLRFAITLEEAKALKKFLGKAL